VKDFAMRYEMLIPLFVACALQVSALADDLPRPVDARQELQAAIDILKTNHMNREKVDWPKLSAEQFASIENATKPEEAYPAINRVIAALGIPHTFLQGAQYMRAWRADASVGQIKAPYWAPPESHLLVGGIGFLSLHGYGAGAQHQADYASGGRAALRYLADAHVCRFVVDLRANQGGDMYAPINAVDALLGHDTLGYWQIGPAGDVPWTDTAGVFEDAHSAQVEVGSLKHRPVAVLLGALTNSAGEFTAIAFKGRPYTRFFGETTYGDVQVNKPFDLPDGGRIAVSMGFATDRLHRPYRTAIEPDQATARGQPTLDAAIAWLKRQPCLEH
jgi:hypothetical protein